MNKGIKTFLWVFLVLAVVGVFYFATSQSVTTSASYLSISQVDVVDGGNKILIYGTVNGAENLKIYFDKDKINSEIKDEGYQIESVPSTLEINMTDPSRDFALTKNQDQIFYKIGTFKLSTFSVCKNNLPRNDAIDLGRVGLNALIFGSDTCAYLYSAGVFSTFSGTQVDNNVVNFKLDGTSIGSLKPSEGTNVVRSNDGKIEVQWVGNLINFKQVTTPFSYAFLFEDSVFSKMIKYSSWSDYKDELQNIGINYDSLKYGGFFGTLTLTDSKITNYNNKVNTFLVNKKSDYESSIGAESVVLTNNGLRVYPSTPTVFPTFKIFLSASYVKLERLSGIPDITQCQDDATINSGDTFNANFNVKNVGTNNGAFYGDITCTGDSNIPIVAVPQKTVTKGSIESYKTQISGINADSGTKNNICKITIRDLNSQKSDTCSFILGVKYQPNIICTPNSVTCSDAKTLKICNSDGTKFDLKSCDTSCMVLESGEAQCVGELIEICNNGIDDDFDNLIDKEDSDCKEEVCEAWVKIPFTDKTLIPNLFCLINNLITPFKWILAILGGILAGVVGFKFSGDVIGKKKKDKWIQIVIALALAVSVGALIFIYFWFGVATLVILGIIKFVIPGI